MRCHRWILALSLLLFVMPPAFGQERRGEDERSGERERDRRERREDGRRHERRNDDRLQELKRQLFALFDEDDNGAISADEYQTITRGLTSLNEGGTLPERLAPVQSLFTLLLHRYDENANRALDGEEARLANQAVMQWLGVEQRRAERPRDGERREDERPDRRDARRGEEPRRGEGEAPRRDAGEERGRRGRGR